MKLKSKLNPNNKTAVLNNTFLQTTSNAGKSFSYSLLIFYLPRVSITISGEASRPLTNALMELYCVYLIIRSTGNDGWCGAQSLAAGYMLRPIFTQMVAPKFLIAQIAYLEH